MSVSTYTETKVTLTGALCKSDGTYRPKTVIVNDYRISIDLGCIKSLVKSELASLIELLGKSFEAMK